MSNSVSVDEARKILGDEAKNMNDNDTKVYQPLPSIDYDYKKLADVLSKLLERLRN